MPEHITEEDAQYAMELVSAICAQAGPGLPGSPGERRRALVIQKELESHLGEANVATEEFSVAPNAFLGSLPISALLLLFASGMNLIVGKIKGLPAWVTALAALLCAILSASVFFSEFMLYCESIDPFFPKKRSVNVVGTLRKPGTHDIKRLLILSGHHDSALENNWIRFLVYGFYITIPTILLGLAAMLGISLLQLVGAVASNKALLQAGTLGVIPLIYPVLPAIVFALGFTRMGLDKGVVPGAADNLSACALLAALCRVLVRNPSLIPEDTEIRFVTFGSEEAGLRGSRRYVERHREELQRLDARLLNFEVVVHPEITILTSDVNGVKNSPEMVSSVAAAAARAGVPHRVQPYPLGGGGSDAGPFSQAGLKAVTLLPFQTPQQIVAFYHQKWDTPEVLTLAPLLHGLRLACEWVRGGG